MLRRCGSLFFFATLACTTACWPVTDTVQPTYAFEITSVMQLDGTLNSATDADDGGPGLVRATFGDAHAEQDASPVPTCTYGISGGANSDPRNSDFQINIMCASATGLPNVCVGTDVDLRSLAAGATVPLDACKDYGGHDAGTSALVVDDIEGGPDDTGIGVTTDFDLHFHIDYEGEAITYDGVDQKTRASLHADGRLTNANWQAGHSSEETHPETPLACSASPGKKSGFGWIAFAAIAALAVLRRRRASDIRGA